SSEERQRRVVVETPAGRRRRVGCGGFDTVAAQPAQPAVGFDVCMGEWQDAEAVRFMLDDCGAAAVVGRPEDTSRTAYSIASLLQERGKRIVPIHPKAPTVLGEQGYATLADVPFPVDVVDVFRRSEAAGEFADQAVAVGAQGV